MQGHTNDSDDPSKPCPPVEPSGIFSGIDPRAVLIGTLADYLASVPLGLVLILVLSFKHSIQFWDENANQALDALTLTPEFLAWAFLLANLLPPKEFGYRLWPPVQRVDILQAIGQNFRYPGSSEGVTIC